MTQEIGLFLDANSARLEELQLPRDALVKATVISLDAFIRQPTTEETQIELPEAVLAGFPKEVRAFLRPNPADR